MSVNAHGVLRECRIARFSKSNFAASGRRAASLNCGIWAVRMRCESVVAIGLSLAIAILAVDHSAD
jgi:hypothetical protein